MRLLASKELRQYSPNPLRYLALSRILLLLYTAAWHAAYAGCKRLTYVQARRHLDLLTSPRLSVVAVETASSQTARSEEFFPGRLLGHVAVGLLLPLLGAGAARKRLRCLSILVAVAALSLGATLGLIGCGGGGHGTSTQPTAGQSPTTYAVEVMARDFVTGLQNTTNLTLTVQ